MDEAKQEYDNVQVVELVDEAPAQPGKAAVWKRKLQEGAVRLKEFYQECLRVYRITRKPNKEELKTIVKISGLGILLIGLIGFVIHAFKEIVL